MTSGFSGLAAFFVLLALTRPAWPADRPSAWDAPAVKNVLGTWADGRAAQVMGDLDGAKRLYGRFEDAAAKLVQDKDQAEWQTVLSNLLDQVRKDRTALDQQTENGNEPRSAKDILTDVARLKTDADKAKGAGRSDEARGNYEVVIRAAALFGKRFPDDDGTARAVGWIEKRSQALLAELAQPRDAGAEEDHAFADEFRKFILKEKVSSALPSYSAAIDGLVIPGDKPSAKAQPWAAATAAVTIPNAGRDVKTMTAGSNPIDVKALTTGSVTGSGIVPATGDMKPAALPNPDMGPALAKVEPIPDANILGQLNKAVAKTYLEVLGGRAELATPEAVLDVLAVLVAARVGPDELLIFADSLAKQSKSPSGPITMGAAGGGEVKGNFDAAALDVYLHVLQTAPGHIQGGSILKRAVKLAVQAGDLRERTAALRKKMAEAQPGLLGLLAFELERSGRHEDEARDLLGLMLAEPDRYGLTRGAAREVLLNGFALFLGASNLDMAGKTADLLATVSPNDAPPAWLALAERLLASDKQDQGRKLLDRIIAGYPLRPEAARAFALLDQKRGTTPDGKARAMTDGELAQLATIARANPSMYRRLGDEYRKAGQYTKARETYDAYARRFDNPEARVLAVLTYFDEGKDAEGVRAAENHMSRYPATQGARDLARRLRDLYQEKRDLPAWVSLVLKVADGVDEETARPYLEDAADVLCRDGLAVGAGAVNSAAVERSRHATLLRRLVEQRAQALRKEIRTTDVNPDPGKIQTLGGGKTLVLPGGIQVPDVDTALGKITSPAGDRMPTLPAGIQIPGLPNGLDKNPLATVTIPGGDQSRVLDGIKPITLNDGRKTPSPLVSTAEVVPIDDLCIGTEFDLELEEEMK